MKTAMARVSGVGADRKRLIDKLSCTLRRPELLVFDCASEANVYPMVPAGAALSEMVYEEEPS